MPHHTIRKMANKTHTKSILGWVIITLWKLGCHLKGEQWKHTPFHDRKITSFVRKSMHCKFKHNLFDYTVLQHIRSKYWKNDGSWVSTHWPMTHVTHWPMTHRPIAYPASAFVDMRLADALVYLLLLLAYVLTYLLTYLLYLFIYLFSYDARHIYINKKHGRTKSKTIDAVRL